MRVFLSRAIFSSLFFVIPFGPPQVTAVEPQDPPEVDQGKVDAAIKKGVQFLKKNHARLQSFDHIGRDMSTNELVLYTLVHAGVPESDPVFQELFQGMLKSKLEATYRVALQAMVLEEVDRVTFQWRIAQCAQFLVDNQANNGQWSYGDPSIYVDDIPTGRRKRQSVATRTGKTGKKAKPKVRRRIRIKKRREGPGRGDNSNTQYAALGLRACHDSGIVLPREVLLRGKRWWEQSQLRDGGWGYRGRSGEAYGSMSSGALGSLVIYHYMLNRKWKRDRRVNKGLRWITDHFTVEENPGKARWYYYYMYALERAGMLYGSEKLGSHWWYAEGANVLLQKQGRRGAWGRARDRGAVWDTCFAILFLRRATRPLEDVETGGSKGGR